jgi:hypothetical protein
MSKILVTPGIDQLFSQESELMPLILTFTSSRIDLLLMFHRKK